MIATSIEQAKRLLKLRLDPKAADMCFEIEKGDWTLTVGKKSAQVNRGFAIPAWSLSALLKVIPKECEPDIQKSPISGVYFAHWFADGKPYITDDHGNAVAAAYEMVCWLLENNLIPNN